MNRFPPPYIIRVSRRARNISLHITRQKGLELVIPRGASKTEAIQFLHTKQRWIEKHMQCLTLTGDSPFEFPAVVELAFLQRQWQTVFKQNPLKRICLRESANTLFFSGNFTDFKQCLPALKKWLKYVALEYLTAYLQQISQETGLFYEKLFFRYQKTLWGSCSNRKNINLNIKLLFLPEKYVRYVLLHELCHTRHFNHSKRFWLLLEKHISCAKVIDKELLHVDHKIPQWYEI